MVIMVSTVHTSLQKPPVVYGPIVGMFIKALYFRPRMPPGKARKLGWLESIVGLKRIVVRTRVGFKFACDQTDWLQRNLLCNGIHEPEITRLLQREFIKGDVFYDIGANSGYFSFLAITCGVHRVIGFEPDPESYGMAIFNRDLNGWNENQLMLEQLALSNQSGCAMFNRASDSGESGFGEWLYRQAVEEISVSVSTLNAYCQDLNSSLPTIIKLDVEGWEYQVFQGSKALLQRHPPRLIIFESTCTENGTIIDKRIPFLLEECGYIVSHIKRLSGNIKPTENYLARLR